MSKRDPRITAYIARQAAFARPILTSLRDVIHEGCPDVVETLKWGAPSFEHHGMLCGFAAFKAHAVFGFWKHELVVEKPRESNAMGGYGRLTRIDDLPRRSELVELVRKAAAINEQGVKMPRTPRAPKKPIPMPATLRAALANNKKAKAVFDAFPPSHKREYLEFVTQAKREETRARRIKQTIAWLTQGKSRNWKYSNSQGTGNGERGTGNGERGTGTRRVEY